MSARRRRRKGGRRRPGEAAGTRYLRPRLPDGTLGKVVPVEFYPRYSTMVGSRFEQALVDVSAFRRVSIPKGRTLTIQIEESDDLDLGWDGGPIQRRRRTATRFAPGRRTERKGAGRRQPQARRRKARGRNTGGGEA